MQVTLVAIDFTKAKDRIMKLLNSDIIISVKVVSAPGFTYTSVLLQMESNFALALVSLIHSSVFNENKSNESRCFLQLEFIYSVKRE